MFTHAYFLDFVYFRGINRFLIAFVAESFKCQQRTGSGSFHCYIFAVRIMFLCWEDFL